jgi:hypothetical protein
MGVNAFAVSLAITTGVAPLLFIQLLYQRFFYSGTILLGWIWFFFLVLMAGGYYAVYVYKFRGAPARGSGGGPWLAVASITFLLVAMTHVAVHLVHVQPEKWATFAERPWIVMADHSYWPRLLHFVLASLAFSALVMAWWAVRRAAAGIDVSTNTSIARSCWSWALWTTSLQVAGGFVLLMALPRRVLIGLMHGGSATLAALGISILLGIGLIMMLSRTRNPVAEPGLVTGTLAALVLTIAVMSITRHQVRMLYLAPIADLIEPKVMPQWGNVALFAVCLVAALAAVGYMVRRVLAEPASGNEAA